MNTEGQEIVTKVFDYDEMLQGSLRSVVRDVLQVAARDGLPGAHHFYITFQTNRSDVVLPDYLRQKHEEEITIVLQHQFWNLSVTDDHFEVELSFNDIREHVSVPYVALISFLDPSVKFGLQFVPVPAPTVEKKSKKAKGDKGEKPTILGNNVVTLDSFRRRK